MTKEQALEHIKQRSLREDIYYSPATDQVIEAVSIHGRHSSFINYNLLAPCAAIRRTCLRSPAKADSIV